VETESAAAAGLTCNRKAFTAIKHAPWTGNPYSSILHISGEIALPQIQQLAVWSGLGFILGLLLHPGQPQETDQTAVVGGMWA
jgi:hypothetical protein